MVFEGVEQSSVRGASCLFAFELLKSSVSQVPGVEEQKVNSREEPANERDDDTSGDALAAIREKWDHETKARNLRLIRQARERRHLDVAWIADLEAQLERAARRLRDAVVLQKSAHTASREPDH